MLYDLAFCLFAVFYVPTLIFKGKLHKDFMERFAEYGASKEEALWKAKDVIWIQAVSVGEVALCKSLIPKLKEKYPGSSIVFSTITKTGNDFAVKLFHDDATIIYFPLDLSGIVKSAIRKIRPKLYIMVETEIWPNVLGELRRKGIPTMIINGRISDRSIGKYRLAKPFLGKTLDAITLFCMQSDVDAERIKELGARVDRVRMTGNMKFDADVKIGDRGVNSAALFGFKGTDRIVVAGSTHDGEEEAIILVYKELVKEFHDLKLVIAPRHVNRATDVEGMIKHLGFNPVRLTKSSAVQQGVPQIYLIDEIGHLNDAYSIAEIVFIGGSLIPHGGQNPIEPAVFGTSVIFGPYMFNFKTVVTSLLKAHGAIQVKGQGELLAKITELLKSAHMRKSFGDNAKRVIAENRGASLRNLDAIEELMHG